MLQYDYVLECMAAWKDSKFFIMKIRKIRSIVRF